MQEGWHVLFPLPHERPSLRPGVLPGCAWSREGGSRRVRAQTSKHKGRAATRCGWRRPGLKTKCARKHETNLPTPQKTCSCLKRCIICPLGGPIGSPFGSAAGASRERAVSIRWMHKKNLYTATFAAPPGGKSCARLFVAQLAPSSASCTTTKNTEKNINKMLLSSPVQEAQKPVYMHRGNACPS